MESNDLTIFNNVCIEFAEQIPYRHPSQHKFAALILLDILFALPSASLSNNSQPVPLMTP